MEVAGYSVRVIVPLTLIIHDPAFMLLLVRTNI